MSMILNPYRYAGSAGGFSPLDVSGCVLWLDAETGVIEDQSGEGNDPSTNSGVVYAASPDRFEFDSGDYLRWTTSPVVGDSTVSYFVVLDSSDSKFVLFWGDVGTETFPAADSGDAVNPISVGSGTLDPYIDGVSASWLTRVDVQSDLGRGTPCVYSDVGADTSSWSKFQFGRYEFGYDFAGDVFEFLIYDSALSTSDREAVESYLGSKWGITITH